jgi:hypothetical protein
MDYNNLDLRNKTIYDFTDDPNITSEIISDKDYFLSNLTETRRAMSLIDYAEYIQDKKLIAAVQKEFEPEFAAFFNE